MGIMQYIIEGMAQQEIEVVGRRKIWRYGVSGDVKSVRLRKEFSRESRLKDERDVRNEIGSKKKS